MKYFRTIDTGLATMLTYITDLVGIEGSSFVFENTDEVREMVENYNKGKTMIEPKGFLERYKDLQDKLYNAIN